MREYSEAGTRPFEPFIIWTGSLVSDPGGRPSSQDGSGYLGWGTILRQGLGAFQPAGNRFLASSSPTEPVIITSWPCFHIGVRPRLHLAQNVGGAGSISVARFTYCAGK